MRLILFGEPGAGKGTLSAMISHRLGIRHVSTGDIFRSEVAKGTPLGKQVGELIARGNLVPDAVVVDVVKTLFENEEYHKGFVLDGFPRTLGQATALDSMLSTHEWTLDGIVQLSVDRETLIKRLSSRRLCRKCATVYNLISYPPKRPGVCDKCEGELYQRDDDAVDAVKVRLGVYEKQTTPLIEYYRQRGVLKTIDTSHDDAEASYAKLMMALGKLHHLE